MIIVSIPVLQSHPVGKSCDFVRHVFNTEGKSPLVEHFLRVNGVERDAGQLVWVQRLELDNLPSYPLVEKFAVICFCVT